VDLYSEILTFMGSVQFFNEKKGKNGNQSSWRRLILSVTVVRFIYTKPNSDDCFFSWLL